jgi:hypothetical protein
MPSSAAAMASSGAAVEQAFMIPQILTNGRCAMAFEIVGRGERQCDSLLISTEN